MSTVVRNKKSQSNKILRQSKSKLVVVRVLDIILDINHPKAGEYGGYDSIGTIFWADIDKGEGEKDKNRAPSAQPLFTHLKYYPLINEAVLLVSASDKDLYSNANSLSAYYLPLINIWGSSHHNALPSLTSLQQNEQTAQDYQETENGIARRVTDEGTDINLGKYFNEKLNIKPLLPYEGDMLIEGRFGNSIRFGSTVKTKIKNSDGEEIQVIPDANVNTWSKETDKDKNSEVGDPIIIIRNGQSEKADEKGWVHTVENINDDPSSIYLTSNQALEGFKVASIHNLSYGADLEEPKEIAIIQPPKEPEPTPPEIQETPELPEVIEDEPVENPPVEVEEEVVEEEVTEEIQTETQEETEDESPFDDLSDETQTGEDGGEETLDGEGPDPGSITLATATIVQGENLIITPEDMGEGYGAFTLGELIYSEIALGNTHPEYAGMPEDNSDGSKQMYDGRRYGQGGVKGQIGGGVGPGRIPNIPGSDPEKIKKEDVLANLKNIAEIVSLIKARFPKFRNSVTINGTKFPNTINSGYRCKELNVRLGGATRSQHMLGEAIDFQVSDAPAWEVFNWIRDNIPASKINQLIWELPEKQKSDGGGSWIHIASKASGKNKGEFKVYTRNDALASYYAGKPVKVGKRYWRMGELGVGLPADPSKIK